jgi:hypothetical protein
MSDVAFVVLAHNDPVQVRRLIAALADEPVFLHCDARTPADVFDAMTADLPARVTLLARRPTHLASWSLVDAELRGLRLALDTTDAHHFAVLSGADYPLATMEQIVEDLAPWRGHSWLASSPLPWKRWSTRFHKDGGLWRLRHRFVTRGDEVLFVRRVPLRTPWRRRIPGELELRASSQWKVYARRHVELILEVVDRRPDIVAFWRTTLVPDETFAASVLSSPALVGDETIEMSMSHPWFIDWPIERTDHPRWLGPAHFDALSEARRAPLLVPGAIATGPSGHRKLFARKFASASGEALQDRIDDELRVERFRV